MLIKDLHIALNPHLYLRLTSPYKTMYAFYIEWPQLIFEVIIGVCNHYFVQIIV